MGQEQSRLLNAFMLQLSPGRLTNSQNFFESEPQSFQVYIAVHVDSYRECECHALLLEPPKYLSDEERLDGLIFRALST